MRQSWWHAVCGFFVAALIAIPGWGAGALNPGTPNTANQQQGDLKAEPPHPGTLNYIEGQASIGNRNLTEKSVGTVEVATGQRLMTENGRAEVLLTPGVTLRIDKNSSIEMVDAGLANTIVRLDSGRALVEVTEIHKANNIRVEEGQLSVKLLTPGLYEFNAADDTAQVFKGRAEVQTDRHHAFVDGGHQAVLNANDKVKSQKFNKKMSEDDFYRWASLRSSYLAEANVDAARAYAGNAGWRPGPWYGAGWYWDPWFDAYTFIPGAGLWYNPFGWGFYSPFVVGVAPYYGYGFGYGYPRHFGPGYHPMYNPATHGPGVVAGSRRSGGFSRGAFGGPGGGFNGRTGGFSRGGFGGGFHGGGAGGFHGGSGGGFHGGGRR